MSAGVEFQVFCFNHILSTGTFLCKGVSKISQILLFIHCPNLTNQEIIICNPEMRRQLQERQELLNQPAPAKRKLKKKKDKDGPKKRARKSKPTEDYQAYMQAVIQQLRNMPPLSLQQPNVAVNYNLCSPPGCNETVSGKSFVFESLFLFCD